LYENFVFRAISSDFGAITAPSPRHHGIIRRHRHH
jgi:hypothetical protein